MRVVQGNKYALSDPPPYIDGNKIIITAYPRSAIVVETSTFVACNYLGRNNEELWWFFVEEGGVIRQVEWNNLTCERQWAVRSVLRSKGFVTWIEEEMPYKDKRYYTLEALL